MGHAGYVCFLDESATRGIRACSWFCVAIVCFERGDAGVERIGYEVYKEVTSMIGWRSGELKWRKLKRAVARRRGVCLDSVVRAIVSSASHCGYNGTHLKSSSNVVALRKRLVAGLLSDTLRRLGWIRVAVLDQGLVPEKDRLLAWLRRAAMKRSGGRVDRIVFRSSEKTIGVQLADLVAGHACSRVCGGCGGLGGCVEAPG